MSLSPLSLSPLSLLPFSLARRAVGVSACLAAGAFVLLANGPARAQLVTFTATDSGTQPGTPPVNSNAKAAQFDTAASALGGESLVTFEAAPVGAFTSLNAAPGVTITGADYQGNPLSINNTPSNPSDPALGGYNTTPGGANYLYIQGGTAVFTFANPVQAFGGYFTGIQPQFFQDTVTFSDGTSRSINIPSGNASSGGVSFAGFTDAGQAITKVTINSGAPPNGSDFIGLDDVRFVPAPAAVPEPSSVAGLGVGGLGLLGLLLRARRRKAPAA